jgi:formamidopyrimidine-DNA glycosylase
VPEGLEVEIWTRAAQVLVGRRIAQVWVDPRCGGHGAEVLAEAVITSVSRRAKTLVIGTDQGVLGMHFGMTGRLVIDGQSPISSLEYASSRDLAEWDRCRIELVDGGLTRVNDPRRWSRYQLTAGPVDPMLLSGGIFGPFGPDAMSLTKGQLIEALRHSRRALKACLLDQSCVAGFGNMCADEVLWRADLDPRRPADGLTDAEISHLAQVIAVTLPEMLKAGGSHQGHISPAVRKVGGLCPRDGSPLTVATVAGRTTVWCCTHQR